MSHIWNDKPYKEHLSLPLEVHFYPQHGSYDTKSILRSGTPLWQSGIAQRRWSFDPEGDMEAQTEINPWAVRDHFLEGETEWDDFTYEFGRFGGGYGYDLRVDPRSYKGTEWSAEFGLENDFREWRALLSRAIEIPMEKWRTLEKSFPRHKVMRLLQRPRFGLRWSDEGPVAVLTAHTALEAILVSLYVDKLHGGEFKKCANPRCGKYFQLTSRPEKKFCGYDCAHYAAVKAARRRKIRAKEEAARRARAAQKKKAR